MAPLAQQAGGISRQLVFCLSISQLASAARFFTQKVLPEGITTACQNALMIDVDCSHAVAALEAGTFYPNTELKQICTSNCASSLAGYHAGVESACRDDTWIGFQDTEEPVAMISEMIMYHYNSTCLVEGDRFCNNVAAAYSVYLDPESAAEPGGMPAGGDLGGLVISDPCDRCLVDNLRFRAGSPYYMGLDLQENSTYQSRTSQCGIANAPLTTTTLSLYSPTQYIPATPTCTGDTYPVKAGDDCHSIAVSQGIGTDWLLRDNNLNAGCADFPSSGDLCLNNMCEVHTVIEGDTCKSIAKEFGVTEAQLKAWNPSVDAGCYNLATMVGDQICISVPGTPYVEPGPTTVAPSIPITAAPLPTNVAAGSNDYCGRWYEAVPGDYCNQVIMRFSISLPDFLFLNSAINENCTNLFAFESYCVQPVGDINTYSGKPGHVTYTFATSGATRDDSATNLPPVAWSSPTPTTTLAPLATGTRDDCTNYLLGDSFQSSVSGTYLSSNCHLAAEVYGVTLEDLSVWNPWLGNASDPGCSFQTGLRYCAKYYTGDRPQEEEAESTLPIRDGMTANCTTTADVEAPMTCQDVLEIYELTIAQFFSMNPSVGADCSGMWLGYQYCVATNDSTVTPPPSTTTAGPTSPGPEPTEPPAPTQTGQPANCNEWHVAADGDDCGVLESQYGISHDQFLQWNPAVSSDCISGFWGGYAYCVGTWSSPGPSIPSSTTQDTVPTAVPTPSPHQDGIVANCNRFDKAQSGEWCAIFAERNSISLANLYAWNTVLGVGGENCGNMFWADTYYCIGVSS